MKINTVIQGIVRKMRRSVVDQRTQNILISEAKRRVRRDQPGLLNQVMTLVDRAHDGDIQCIQPILKRCYLRGQYRDHELIRYFLKAKIDAWPNESFDVVVKQGNTLEFDANNPGRLSLITFPLLEERQVPSVSSLLGVEDVKAPDILPIDGSLYINKHQHMNDMLTKVLKLYKFLRSNDFIHSRNLGTPIAITPLNVLGDEVIARKKNVIKKKISHIRYLFMNVPPLEYKDAKYLTRLVDHYTSKDIKREYKKFLRKTYTIDKDFNILMNKYSKAQANDIEDVYMQKKKV